MSLTQLAQSSPIPQKRWRDIFTPATCIRLAIVVLLLYLIYSGPFWQYLIFPWTHDSDWSHGWLIPIFSLYFLHRKRHELFRAAVKPSYWGAVVLLLSLAMYFSSAWLAKMAYPQVVSIVGAIFGVTLLLGGWAIMRVAWFPILFLLFSIPVPNRIYVSTTLPLRKIASSAAATIMPFFADGLYVETQGTVIDYVMPGLPPNQLNVEEACSGMRMMMAFVTLGVAMAYLGDRKMWERVLLLASCIPIAVICNMVRVTITGLLVVHGHPELAQGNAHAALGMSMLALAFGLYALIGYVLSNILVEEDVANAGA